MEHARRAIPHDEREPDGRQHVDHGRRQGLQALDLEPRLQAHAALCLEALVLLIFLHQALDGADRRQGLLRHRGHEPVARSRVARRRADAPSVAQDRGEEERRDRERDQGEPPVDPEHGRDHPRQEERVVDHDVRGIRDQIVDGVDVPAEPRGQVARPLPVVESKREPLHVREEPAAQVERELLADRAHRARVVEGRETRPQRDQ